MSVLPKILLVVIASLFCASICYCFNAYSCSRSQIKTLPDTIKKNKRVGKKSNLEEGYVGPTWDEVMGELLKRYKDTVKFDDTYKLPNGDILKVKFRHYCTFDGKIIIPHRYLWGDHKLKSFKTHSFESLLDIKLNSKTTFHGIITKNDFKSEFRDSLKQYAILQFPYVKVVNGTVFITYTLGIPLTDVGKGVKMQVDINGIKTIVPEQVPLYKQKAIATPASPAKIMAALFGSYNSKTKTSTWACNNKALLNKFNVPANTLFVSKPAFIDSVSFDNGGKELLVITASRPNDDDHACHGCPAQLEYFKFGLAPSSGWVQTVHQTVGYLGSFGEAPPIQLIKIGKESYGFLFSPGFTGQGITTEAVVLYTQRYDGFKQILDIEDAAMDNSGACDENVPNSCWQYTYKLDVVDAQKNYNDLLFTQKGTKVVNGKKVSAKASVKYHFAGTSYAIVK